MSQTPLSISLYFFVDHFKKCNYTELQKNYQTGEEMFKLYFKHVIFN